jgi:glycosyltransferase involved in cell wall biosynthesis
MSRETPEWPDDSQGKVVEEDRRMPKVTVFFGGSIGSDPKSPRTWSGIGLFLLRAMDNAGILDRAEGIKVPRLHNSFLLAKNFHRDRSVWRTHYYFDPAYRRALSQAASHVSITDSLPFQTGHMFSLPEVFPQEKCISYNDGNLSQGLKSGFGFEGISRRRIDESLRYEEQTARQMAAVFTTSEYLRQSFIGDYGVPAERVFNVGAGINLTNFPAHNPHKDYTAPRILFIGIDFVRKGGPQLLEAFQIVHDALPNAELHIVGPAKLKDPPAGVVCHGFLSKADPAGMQELESLFRDCSLFVLPSLYEPFGIAPLEAMLYQLPCLVTDAWALRETVIPGFNGDLVPKGAVEGMAAKLLQLLSNPEALATMGQQGRERVLRDYTWTAVVDRMSAALRTVQET